MLFFSAPKVFLFLYSFCLNEIMAENGLQNTVPGRSSAVLGVNVGGTSGEWIELIADVPSWAGVEYRSLHACLFDVRSFCTMFLDVRNGFKYDRAEEASQHGHRCVEPSLAEAAQLTC